MSEFEHQELTSDPFGGEGLHTSLNINSTGDFSAAEEITEEEHLAKLKEIAPKVAADCRGLDGDRLLNWSIEVTIGFAVDAFFTWRKGDNETPFSDTALLLFDSIAIAQGIAMIGDAWGDGVDNCAIRFHEAQRTLEDVQLRYHKKKYSEFKREHCIGPVRPEACLDKWHRYMQKNEVEPMRAIHDQHTRFLAQRTHVVENQLVNFNRFKSNYYRRIGKLHAFRPAKGPQITEAQRSGYSETLRQKMAARLGF